MSDEKTLVNKVLEGNLPAFGELVSRYEKLVFFIIRRMVTQPEDVEDICQEVFIKVHRKLSTFGYKSRLSTWIAHIAYTTSLNHLKKYKQEHLLRDPELPDHLYFTHEDPGKLAETKDVATYLHALIAQLPDQYRTVLTLYHLKEFSYLEIEAITGMPEGTVKNYLFRARKILKEKLVHYLRNETV